MLFELRIEAAEQRGFARAGAAVQKNQRGIGPGYAAQPDALGYASYWYCFHGSDAAGDDTSLRIPEWLRVDTRGGEEKQCRSGEAAAQAVEECRVEGLKGLEKLLWQWIHVGKSIEDAIVCNKFPERMHPR